MLQTAADWGAAYALAIGTAAPAVPALGGGQCTDPGTVLTWHNDYRALHGWAGGAAPCVKRGIARACKP